MTTASKAINSVYTLHGQILEIVTSEKYLGLTSWNPHIDRITGNLNRTLGYIRRNINTKTSTGVKSDYLGPLHQGKTFKLECTQRRAARWSTSNYGYGSNLTAIFDLLSDARLCICFKMVHELVTVPFTDYVQPTHSVLLLPLNDFSPDSNQQRLVQILFFFI